MSSGRRALVTARHRDPAPFRSLRRKTRAGCLDTARVLRGISPHRGEGLDLAYPGAPQAKQRRPAQKKTGRVPAARVSAYGRTVLGGGMLVAGKSFLQEARIEETREPQHPLGLTGNA